jgi:aspartyl aminopeptidase
MLVCNDHEEVGSTSACGANGPMLQSVLQRLYPDPGLLTRVMRQSLLVSADNAHGIHPNFADRHDSNHGPRLNEGPVIKINANQRYATNSISAAMFRHLCEKEGVAVQTFVNRTDLSCGSTIGPITAAMIGVQTLDVGVPTFAMHSIREMAGADDAFNLYRALRAFYNHQPTLMIQEA